MVTILPIWHITERAAELCIFSRGVKLVYSNVRNLKNDLGMWNVESHKYTHCILTRDDITIFCSAAPTTLDDASPQSTREGGSWNTRKI